jgi:hypothetical protein
MFVKKMGAKILDFALAEPVGFVDVEHLFIKDVELAHLGYA